MYKKKIKITKRWLKKHGSCESGIKWFESQNEEDGEKLLQLAMNADHFDWINWVLVRRMDKSHKIKYAIYAAELVLNIYEQNNPKDDRPRKAIEAAKAYLRRPCKKNVNAAADAADAAESAADAAESADAAFAAAYAAYAAYAAAESADAANTAAYAAAYAAHAANTAADAAANAETKKKIIKTGVKILTN